MANNSYFTVDEVVANALTVIPSATQKDKNIFKQWVFLAERQIGSSDVSIKIEPDIVVTNLRVGKPSDCIKPKSLFLFDSDGREVIYRHHGLGKQISDRNENESINRDIILTETNDAFYLSSNGSNVVSANLRYYGFPTDENGDLKIPEIHIMAIIAFINYMMSMRTNESRLITKDFYAIWKSEMVSARARTNMPSELEAQYIARRFVSLIDYMNRDY